MSDRSILYIPPTGSDLLDCSGPGHSPAIVGCYDGAWSDDTSGVAERLASPLLWHGAPVDPAIDALVRAIEAEGVECPVEIRSTATDYPGILALAREAAAVLGGEAEEVTHA